MDSNCKKNKIIKMHPIFEMINILGENRHKNVFF